MTKPTNLRQIDKSAPIPIYFQIKEILMELIESLEPGKTIPTILELCSYFEVARPTVRQAIGELVTEGLLSPEKGRGTFVLKPKIPQNTLYTIQSFRAEMEKKGHEYRSIVLEMQSIPCDEHLGLKLHLEEGVELIKLRRLRLVDGSPLILLVDYLPADAMRRLFDYDLSKESLANLIELLSGHNISHSDRNIEARPAGEYEAKMLQIPKGSPLLNIEIVTYLSDGTPIHYALANYRGDRSSFAFTLRKTGDTLAF